MPNYEGGGYRDDPYAAVLAEMLKERAKAGQGLIQRGSQHKGGGTVGEGVLQMANAALGGYLEGRAERDAVAKALLEQQLSGQSLQERMNTLAGASTGGTAAGGGAGAVTTSEAPQVDPNAIAPAFAGGGSVPTMALPSDVAGAPAAAPEATFGSFGPTMTPPDRAFSVDSAAPVVAAAPVPTGQPMPNVAGEGAMLAPRDAVAAALAQTAPVPTGRPMPNVAGEGSMIQPPREAVAAALSGSAPQPARVASLDPLSGTTAPKALPPEAGPADLAAMTPKLEPIPQAPASGRDGLATGVYQAYRNAGYSHEGALQLASEVGREGGFSPKNVFGTHLDPHNGAVNAGMMSWQGSRGKALLEDLTAKGLVGRDGRIVQDQRALDAMAAFTRKEMESDPKTASLSQMLQRDGFDGKEATQRLGRDYIKWRIDDPKYSADGLARKGEHYDQLAALTSGGRVQVASNDPAAGYREASARSGASGTQVAQAPLDIRPGANAPAPNASRSGPESQARPSLPPMPTMNDLVPDYQGRMERITRMRSDPNPIVQGHAIREGQMLVQELTAARTALAKAQQDRAKMIFEDQGQNYRQGQGFKNDSERDTRKFEQEDRRGSQEHQYKLEQDRRQSELRNRELTPEMKEYNLAQAQRQDIGREPETIDQWRLRREREAKIDPTYRIRRERGTGDITELQPIPGSEEAAKREEKDKKEAKTQAGQDRFKTIVTDKIDESLSILGRNKSVVGSTQGNISALMPGTSEPISTRSKPTFRSRRSARCVRRLPREVLLVAWPSKS
jgi:hypothetical protein